MGAATGVDAADAGPSDAHVPDPQRMSIFVLCPADAVTGGPELLHQLVDLLRSRGRDAKIVYYPFGTDHRTPAAYAQYDLAIGTIDEVTPRSIFVVPEIYAWLLRKLPKSRIFFWWLSVDNFLASATANRLRHFIPKRLLWHLGIVRVRRFAAAHLYQSEYARLFLARHRLSPSYPLSDYLSAQIVEAATKGVTGEREDLVVYNPLKGAAQTTRIADCLATQAPTSLRMVPIRGLTRQEVVDTLSKARLYIDFGHHPGKDRLPREAAALGCCVLTNRQGSAANDVDVPIPLGYKIDDTKPGFAPLAAEKIVEICVNFDRHAPDFDAYRRTIAAEPGIFAEQAESLITEMDAASS